MTFQLRHPDEVIFNQLPRIECVGLTDVPFYTCLMLARDSPGAGFLAGKDSATIKETFVSYWSSLGIVSILNLFSMNRALSLIQRISQSAARKLLFLFTTLVMSHTTHEAQMSFQIFAATHT